MTTQHFDTIILGGGISGLSAAYFLKEQKVAVLEASNKVGGKIQSEEIHTEEGTFLLEAGPDSWVSRKKSALNLIKELGLSDELIGTNDHNRKISILKNGKLMPMPDGMMSMIPTKIWPFITSKLISPLGKLRMGFDLFLPRSSKDDESLESFVKRRLGREALEYLAEPLLSGFLNADPKSQSIRATMPELHGLEKKYRSLTIGMLKRKKPATTEKKTERFFTTFTAGTEKLIHGLKNSLNCAIFTNTKAVHISRRDTEITLICDTPEGSATFTCSKLICTLPPPAAAKLLFNAAPKIAEKLQKFRAISSGCMYLAFKKDDVPLDINGFGLVVPKVEKRKFNAITWCSSKLNHRAPKNCHLMRVFYGGSKTPEMMRLTELEKTDVILSELRDVLKIKSKPLFTRIYENIETIPQYDVGHLERLDALKVSLPENIVLIGAGYGGSGIPDCIEQASIYAKQNAQS